jgi:hypothetical protein
MALAVDVPIGPDHPAGRPFANLEALPQGRPLRPLCGGLKRWLIIG